MSSAAVAAMPAGSLGIMDLPTVHFFRLAFGMVGAVAVLASLTALAIPRHRGRTVGEQLRQAEPAAERVSGT